MPRYLQRVELPDGRGFVVKSGRTHRVQVATPYHERGDDNIESDLDGWITKIVNRSHHSKNEWVYVPEVDEEDGEEGESGGSKVVTPSKKSAPTVVKKSNPRAEFIKKKAGKIDIEKLKQQMSEQSFLPASFYNHHAPEDLIREAIERGIIDAPDELKG